MKRTTTRRNRNSLAALAVVLVLGGLIPLLPFTPGATLPTTPLMMGLILACAVLAGWFTRIAWTHYNPTPRRGVVLALKPVKPKRVGQ